MLLRLNIGARAAALGSGATFVNDGLWVYPTVCSNG